MKRYLHKLPTVALAILMLGGCKKIEDKLNTDFTDNSFTQDTVKVLNIKYGSYGNPSYFWGVNRQGVVISGPISKQPGVVFPHDGDEIVVRYLQPYNRHNRVGIFDNITQRKRAEEYVKQNQR